MFFDPALPRPTGKGISIAVLDTGISPAADFTLPENRILAFKDFVNHRTEPYDDNGHGTQVTGGKKLFYDIGREGCRMYRLFCLNTSDIFCF